MATDGAKLRVVSRCLHMGLGIATTFKQKFGCVQQLKDQQKVVGECAVLAEGDRFLYYRKKLILDKTTITSHAIIVITKDKYYHKPTMQTLRQALVDCR